MSLEAVILAELERLRHVAPAGFAVALHIRFTSARYMFQTYPDAWVQEYGRDGLVTSDPSVAWALMHTGSVLWEDLSHVDQDGVFQRAAAHGIRYGLTASVLWEGSRSIGGFARSDRCFTSDEATQLAAALGVLHEATKSGQTLSEEAQHRLHRLAITSTHP